MITITISELLRTTAALACFSILPGYLLTRLLFRKRRPTPFLTAPISIGLGITTSIVASYAAELAKFSLSNFAYLMLGLDLAGSVMVAIGRVRGMRRRIRRPSALRLRSLVAFLIVFLSYGIIFRVGPRVRYTADAWYHITYIREAVETDSIVPGNALDEGAATPENVKRWHTILAAVAVIADVRVERLWWIGNAFVGALALAVTYSLARTILGGPSISIVAMIVFIATDPLIQTYVYPWGIGYVLMWISLILVFRYLDTLEARSLVLGMLIGLSLNFVHGLEYIFVCFVILAICLARSVAYFCRQANSSEIARLWMVLGVLLLVGVPVFVLNYPGKIQSNLTHLKRVEDAVGFGLYPHATAQVLAALSPPLRLSGVFIQELSFFGLMALPLSLLILSSRDREPLGLLKILAWAPFLAYVAPGLSWCTNLVLGDFSYRLSRLAPTPLILALGMHEGHLRGLFKRDVAIDPWRAASATVILVALLPVLFHRVSTRPVFDPPRSVLDLQTPLQHQAMYDALDALRAKPVVVLSDPGTSTAIPALTKHTGVTRYRWQGSDLEEFILMRELLSSPHQTAGTAVQTLDEYDIDLIVVNTLWRDESLYPGQPFYFYSEFTLPFLEGNPDCFSLVYKDETYKVFEYRNCRPDQMELKGRENQESMIETVTDDTLTLVDETFGDRLRLVEYTRDSELVAGSEFEIRLLWEARREIKVPAVVWLELLCDYPGKTLPMGKALRLWKEIWGGGTYKVETEGWLEVPPGGLQVGDRRVQSLSLTVPRNLQGGTCDLQVQVADQDEVINARKLLPHLLMENEYLYVSLPLESLTIQQP